MVKRLENYKSLQLPDNVKKILSSYSHVFNPSYIEHKGVKSLAVRVHDIKTQKILALILTWENERKINQINMSEYFQEKIAPNKVADPKLFVMNDKIFGSFNNSHALKEPNTLVLFELDKKAIIDYSVCIYTERTKTEKNWAFYFENDALYALYSLKPLTIIKATTIKENTIIFDKYYIDEKQYYKNFSIGTPLVKLKEGYGLIAHKKYFRKRKILYLGKPFLFSIKGKPKVEASKKIVIHSFKSLFGNKFKFNKNLISCSYFSGIHIAKDNLVLSYGINDVDYNIAIIKKDQIWH